MRTGWIGRAAAVLAFGMAPVWISQCMLLAQESQANGTGQPQMMAHDADPKWEVTTVKPADPNDVHRRIVTDGRLLRLEGQTVERLLMLS